MLRERIYSFIAATMICVLCAAGGYAMARQWACDESWDGPGREAKIETAAKAAKEMGLVNEDRPTPAETVKAEPEAYGAASAKRESWAGSATAAGGGNQCEATSTKCESCEANPAALPANFTVMGSPERLKAVLGEIERGERKEYFERSEERRLCGRPGVKSAGSPTILNPMGSPQGERLEGEKTSLGTFTVTFYCACETCCGKWSNENDPLTASGARAEAGVTVGADWETLPEGTEIEIEGLGRRVVQDKPAEWIVEKYDGRIIDVFCASHEEALKLGKQEAEVWAWD